MPDPKLATGKTLQMTRTIKPGNMTHSITPQLQAQRNAPDLAESVVGDEVQFHGMGRIGQVLRWVSTAALRANKAVVKKHGFSHSTPEVQASVIGGRLLLGTNIDQDNKQTHLPGELTALMQDPGTFAKALKSNKARPEDTPENTRLKLQERRHLSHLHSFVNDPQSFDAFVAGAVRELRESRDQDPDFALSDNPMDAHQATRVATRFKAFEDQEHQLRSMFETVRDSLIAGPQAHGPRIQMARAVKNKHAEQRIIEHVQSAHDDEEAATRIRRNKPLLPDVGQPSEDLLAPSAPVLSPMLPQPTSPSNRIEDPKTGHVSYRIPEHQWDLDSPRRKAAKAKLAAAMNPKSSGRVTFLAGSHGLVHTPDELAPNTLMAPLGGTKPPCDHCSATELARHQVAQTQPQNISPIEFTRFEDPGNEVGPLFPGKYANSADLDVQTQTALNLSDVARQPKATTQTHRRKDSLRMPKYMPPLGDEHR